MTKDLLRYINEEKGIIKSGVLLIKEGQNIDVMDILTQILALQKRTLKQG